MELEGIISPELMNSTYKVKRRKLNSKEKWRQEHREEYREDQRKYAAKYYENNSEKVLQYKRDKDVLDKQWKQLRMMLFDENSED